MDSYDFDLYLKFVPTLYTTSSRSEYYEWEDDIEAFYRIGELPLNQLVNLAKQTFSFAVLLWWRQLQQDLTYQGDNYCTSWAAMKSELRHRFDPPLESKKKIVELESFDVPKLDYDTIHHCVKEAVSAVLSKL